jgi:hypothetical protein
MTRRARAILCLIIGLSFVVAVVRDLFLPQLFTVSEARPVFNAAWAVFFLAMGVRRRRLSNV